MTSQPVMNDCGGYFVEFFVPSVPPSSQGAIRSKEPAAVLWKASIAKAMNNSRLWWPANRGEGVIITITFFHPSIFDELGNYNRHWGDVDNRMVKKTVDWVFQWFNRDDVVMVGCCMFKRHGPEPKTHIRIEKYIGPA